MGMLELFFSILAIEYAVRFRNPFCGNRESPSIGLLCLGVMSYCMNAQAFVSLASIL